MLFLIVAISFACLCFCYYLVSKKDGSYFNFLTPSYLLFIPGYYLFELFHIHKFGPSGATSSYLFIYATYSFYYLAMACAYLAVPSIKVENESIVKINHESAKLFGWAFLAMGLIFYLPILYEFKDLLSSPREIYQLTRTGYGLYYFLSTTFTYVAFIIFLFCRKKIIPFLCCTFIILLHGSKGQLLNLILIYFLYQVYVKERRIKFKAALRFFVILPTIIIGLFYFTLNDTQNDGLLTIISEYADYNRNSLKIIDDHPAHSRGRLLFEDAVFSRLPRLLYEDKPKDFGHFFLAKEYIPERFDDDTGSPDFGIVGLPFYDFGYFSIFYLISWGVLIGALGAYYKNKLKKSSIGRPGYLIVFCFISGISLIPTGAGYLLPEHLLLAILVNSVLKIELFLKNIRFRKRLT